MKFQDQTDTAFNIAALNFGAQQGQKYVIEDGDPQGDKKEYILALLRIQEREISKLMAIVDHPAPDDAIQLANQ
jgi:hypothetical protein